MHASDGFSFAAFAVALYGKVNRKVFRRREAFSRWAVANGNSSCKIKISSVLLSMEKVHNFRLAFIQFFQRRIRFFGIFVDMPISIRLLAILALDRLAIRLIQHLQRLQLIRLIVHQLITLLAVAGGLRLIIAGNDALVVGQRPRLALNLRRLFYVALVQVVEQRGALSFLGRLTARRRCFRQLLDQAAGHLRVLMWTVAIFRRFLHVAKVAVAR